MVMNDQMWLIKGSFTLGSMRYCLPHMRHHLRVMMSLLLSLLRLKNWSSFSMMRVCFTPMMIRVGCGVKKTKLLLNLKAKEGD